jgi:hypothetical protein
MASRAAPTVIGTTTASTTGAAMCTATVTAATKTADARGRTEGPPRPLITDLANTVGH